MNNVSLQMLFNMKILLLMEAKCILWVSQRHSISYLYAQCPSLLLNYFSLKAVHSYNRQPLTNSIVKSGIKRITNFTGVS